MKDRNLLKKRTKLLAMTVSVIVCLMLTDFCAYSGLHGEKMHFATNGVVVITFFILPYLFLGALYGYLISLLSFTVSFIIALINNTDSAYNMAIYLVATICFSLFSQYYFFSTKKRTAIAAAVTLALTSLMELLCISLIAVKEYSLIKLTEYVRYLYRDVVVIFGVAFLLHFFLTRVPDIFKTPFPLAIGYTKAFRENKEVRRSIRKTRVSMKITAIIIGVELLLGISVAVFMAVLFPDIKSMFASSIHQGEIFSDIEAGNTIDREDIAEQVEDMRYRLDAAAISYDIKMLLLMLCVGVPMAGFANYYTKTTIGGPLGNMSDFMKEYAEADDEKKLEVGHKVDNIRVRSRDEIRVVHESMKETVHAIEEYIGRINEENELQKELEVAQKASEAKSSFLSNMSHEIRTPINAVLGLNEMILRESRQEQILEYAESVKSAGNSLLGIVNDILDFSKIEAGKMDILPSEYHLGSTINDLINLVSAKAEDKGLALNMNIDEKLPSYLIGDEIRIKQCVTNILTNAVKYTQEGSVTLEISYRKADENSIFLKFRVVDTGIGIKEEDLEKLFSPFERIEEIRNRSIEGTGLGMSIVKKLLALMDTRLEVKSVYGEGSDFSFEVKQEVASWEELGDYKEKYRQFLKGREKYHEKFKAPDACILVVDDTPINLTVVKGLLKKTEIEVDTAESGMEALDKVRKKKYDMVFIDHRMPEMDGLETLQAMKDLSDNLSADAPCIALTANAGAGAKDEYIAAGFNDYLSKPVNSELLEDMIKEYLPSDKIQETAGEESEKDADADSENADAADKEEGDVLDKMQGIDLAEAEKNCGSRELLKDVIKEFYISINPKADSIEKFAAEKDYRNYTVTVHALKSSARLIGAAQLSQMAAELEEYGNEENEEKISEMTPQLLSLFRSYSDKISAIEPKRDDDLPVIDVESLEGAFSDMKELLEAYDFDTADGIMNMLSDYRIPDEYRDKYDEVKELMAAVDRDALLELL
jgi:signal transduction histidine kinase/CheY-like chemotaxis protein/HPt (histidine-containing phosphotransfer) domain-containing protein